MGAGIGGLKFPIPANRFTAIKATNPLAKPEEAAKVQNSINIVVNKSIDPKWICFRVIVSQRTFKTSLRNIFLLYEA